MENKGKEEKKRRPRRSRQEIQKMVLDAVSSLVKEKGFSNITITAISQKSEVDVNAILRGFGSLEQLLDMYSHFFDYWFRNTLENPDRLQNDPIGYYRESVINLADMLYNNREMQEMLIWEICDDNPTTRKVALNREISNGPVIAALTELFKDSGINFDVMAAILIAGIYYLILRRKRSTFFGVDFSTRKGKARLLETIKQSVDICFDILEKRNEVYEIVRRMNKKGVDIETIAEYTCLEKKLIMKIISSE